MKIFFCLFERPFEIQKNGVFLFEISFLISDIFLLCKWVQWWHHLVCNQKLVKYSINNISKTIEAVLLELGITNVHHERNKMTPLNLHHLLQPIWWLELRQYGNYVCSKQDPLPHFKGCKRGHLFFYDRETGAERVAVAIK